MVNNPRRFSQIIVEAMKRYDLNFEKLSRLTNISERYLEALIEERFEALPPAPYVHGYIKKIAKVLELDGDQIWNEFLKYHPQIRRSGEKDRLPSNRFAFNRVFLKPFLIFLVLVFLISVYFILKSFFYYQPEITFLNLNEGDIITKEPELVIKGKVKLADLLTLNGNRIYPDTQGNFETVVTLQPGLNALEFRAKKILSGKEIVITKKVIYQTEETSSQNNVSP